MATQAEAPEDAKPKKGRKGKNAQPGDNLVATNKALASQLKEVFKLKDDLDAKTAEQRSASSRYRSGVKIAKALGKHLGVETSDIIRIVDLKARDPEEIDRETARLNRLCLLAKIPVGTTLGMFDAFDGGKSVATAIEDGMAEQPVTGGDAFIAGHILDQNPHPAGSKPHRVWERDWLHAQQVAAKGDEDRTLN